MPTAILVEDEPLPRAELREQLQRLWPELELLGEAVDGPSGLALFQQVRPDIVFLDIRLPGMTGIELAQVIGLRAHLAFVTAMDAHALEAFEHGAIDYVLKPVQLSRLATTVDRLRQRVLQPPRDLKRALDALGEAGASGPLRWLRVGEGDALRLVTVGDVLFFRAEAKYTQVVTAAGQWWIRPSLRELAEQLDPEQFWQIHRGTLVNLAHVDWVERTAMGHVRVHLKGHADVLPVSQTFQARFRQM